MPTPGTVVGSRGPAAWDDPAGRVLASFLAVGVAFADRRLLAGEPIYGEGDPDGGLHFVVWGSARVYKRYGPRGGPKEATLEGARPHRDNAEPEARGRAGGGRAGRRRGARPGGASPDGLARLRPDAGAGARRTFGRRGF